MYVTRLVRKIALVTMLIFTWMNLVINYGHAQQGNDVLAQARELYRSERYDAAVSLIQKFIGLNLGTGTQKDAVSAAYYLLAKIYYQLREDNEMKETLEKLFSLSPQYNEEESNEGFKKVLAQYRDNVKTVVATSGPISLVEKPAKDAEKKISKKTKFPVLLVIGGIVVVGVLVYLLLKKPKYMLTVDKGVGVSGGPESSVYEYKKGTSVTYTYSVQSGYKNLIVTLDGQSIGSSGTITMNANHSLTVTTEQKLSYNLNVSMGIGVAGSPTTGTYLWEEGQTASYNYSLQTDYKNLVVKLDNVIVTNSGTIAMNGSHNLDASATFEDPNPTYRLVVQIFNAGGSPSAGTYYYKKDTVINYDFYSDSFYQNLAVMINSVYVCSVKYPTHCVGSFVMNRDTNLLVQGVYNSPMP